MQLIQASCLCVCCTLQWRGAQSLSFSLSQALITSLCSQEPNPAKVPVTSSSSVPDIHAVEQVLTSKSTLWQEELRGRSTIACSRSAPSLCQLSQPSGPQGPPTGTPKEDHRRVSGDHAGGGRKARVESGYFSLEKIKLESRPPPPQQLQITSPTRYSYLNADALTPCRSPEYCDPFLSSHSPTPFSSQSSLDSEASSSTQTSGASWEARSHPARSTREYASLADIPKAKRISNRDAFQVEKKRLEQRTRARSPGREEVVRIFGTERRRSQVIDQFETLDRENAELMETSSSSEPCSSSSSTSRQGRSERRSYPRKQERTLEASKEGFVPDVSAPPISPNHRARSLDRRATKSSMTPDLLNFKKGWMTKLYEDNQWKKHWFVLTDQILRYYRDSIAEEAADLDGEIDLSTCHDVTEFPVQRNYGFQIHTKEGAITLCAMTSGIRRNWIQAIMKNARPATAPDVTSSFPEEAKVHSGYKNTSAAGEIQESEVDGGSTEQRRSRARERRREGCSKTFDWAEFRPMQKTSSPPTLDSTQISEAASKDPGNMTDLERERAQRREERRKRFESLNAAEEVTRMEVDRATASPETKPVQVEIEQRWHKVETMPLREEKQIPIATLREEKQIPITMLHSSVPVVEPLPPQEQSALLDNELGQTQRELSRLQQENHLLQEQLEEARGREHSAREGYILQTDTAASPVGSWQSLHKLNQDLQTEIESQRQRQDLTNQQVQALKLDYGEAKDVIKDHEVEIQNLQTKLNNAMAGIQISEQAIAKMRSDLKMEQEFREGLEDWEHNEQTLRSQLRDSEDRLKDVEALLLEKSQALRDLERQQALQRDYQKEVQKLQDRLTEVTSQLVTTEQAQALKEERVQKNYEMLRESHEKEKESLALTLVEAEEKVREFEDRLQEAEQQVDDLQKEKRATTLESSEIVHHFEEELVIKNVAIQKLTENIRDLEEEKDQLTCRCQELINQITEADSEVAKLQSRLKTEETDYYNLEHSYEKVSEELQKIHKMLREKDEEIKQAKEMYERLMEKKDRDLNEALIKMAALGSSLEETECKLQLKEELISKIGHSCSEAGSTAQKEELQCKLEAAEFRITELEQLLDDLQLGYSKLQLENGKLQEDCVAHENIRKQESSTALDESQTTNVRPKVRMNTDTGAALSKRQRIWFSSIHCQKYGQDDTEKLWASSTSSDTSQDRSLSEESGTSDPPHYLPSANTDPERFISIIHSLETKLFVTEEKLKDVNLKLEEQESQQQEVMMEHHSKWAKTETELREQLGESLSKVDTLTAQLQLERDKSRTFAQETSCRIRPVCVTCEKALVCLESGREKVQSILACHKENSTDQQLHTLSEIEAELVNAAIHIGQGQNSLEEEALNCQEAPEESRENELSDEDKIKLFAKMLAFEALVLNKMANSIQNPNLDLLRSLSEVHKEAEKLKSSDESFVAIAYKDVLTQKLMLESEFWSEVEKLQTQFKETDNSGQESKPGGPGLLEQAGKTVVTNACIKAELTFAVQNLKEFYEQKIQKVEGDLLKARRDLQQREFTVKEIVKAYKTPELDKVILQIGDEFKKERSRKLPNISLPELSPYVEQIQMKEVHNLAVLMVDQHLQYETPPLEAVEPSSQGRAKLANELKQQAEVLQRLSQDMESTCHSQTVEIHHRLLEVSHVLPCYMYTNKINNSPSLLMRDALIQAQIAYVACRIKADHEKDLKQYKDACSNMYGLCQENVKNVNSIRKRYEKALQEERHTFAQAILNLKDENQALKAEASHHLSELSLQQSRILQMEERFQHEMEELKNKYELELHQAQHKLTEAEGALWDKTAESQRKLETVVLDIESMEERHEDQVQKLEDRFHGKIQELQRIHEEEMQRLHGHYSQTIKALPLTLDKYKCEHLEASPSESCKHHKEPRPEDNAAGTQTQGEKTELDSMTVLRERIQELEAQMNVMRDELEHKHLEGDMSSLKEKYQKDFENFKATCERGFAAMEETHQKVLEDIQRQHQREVGKLQEEKERLLAEETAATIAAIEAMKNAHREELERTQRAEISGMSSDIEELRRRYQEELQSIQRELEVLSEQYSQKCLENAHLVQALEAERQALRQCQRENQDLNAHNQELNNRLAAEITRLRSCHSGDGAGSPLTQGKDVYELEVLLRVKESEIQYLKQEIHSLKDELQTALRDKKYTTDKYKDIYTELSIVKAKADCDITKLRDQLIAATEALGEKSAENSTVSGYDIMKSKSNPDFLKKERSSISRQIRSMRSKSLKEGLSVQEQLKLFEARDSKKI
ncbi:protein lava lamp-like isoform X1 [Acipenser oxyrinchus oxyrinchus]|uniref:Protein lava lamp-like isoform X1 n=1 Tax=Acipenser oxyrinchus oxyrinchus TaxID=40147 RepID=A0AAD8FZ87_ACIOX|nr:protein lava lamp-like isoform X1 [Acipenser oxyrinchus oxyrinchus]